MKPLHRIKGAASAAMKVLVQTSLLSGALIAFVTGIASGEAMEKKGTTPYVTHFVFRPLQNINIEGVGSVTLLEATGTTDNMKGEKMLDKMAARCEALSVDSGSKKYIDGACVLADADGDKIFRPSTRATSTSLSQAWPAARMSSRAVRANTRASPAASPLPATHCPPWLVKGAIPRWTSRTTRPGRSKDNNSQCSDNSKCGTGTDCEPGRPPDSLFCRRLPMKS